MTSTIDNRASLSAEHNEPSSLLSSAENDQLFQLLGTKKFTQSTGVAQIFSTEPPAHSKWEKCHTGVLCFVKDHVRRSYFMQMYCLTLNELVWEHEVYEPFIINMPRAHPFMLIFEGSDRVFSFNFVSEEEAAGYLQAARNLMSRRMKKQEDRSRRTTRPLNQNVVSQSQGQSDFKFDDDSVTLRRAKPKHSITTNKTQHNISTAKPQTETMTIRKNNKNDKKFVKNITKADIGTPSNFKHVTHVGWDSSKGFNFEGEDQDVLVPFLEKAGVSKKLLKNRETKAFILDFVQSNNVLETIKSEQTLPPVPKRHSITTSGEKQKPNRVAPPPPNRTSPNAVNAIPKPPRVTIPEPPKRSPQVTLSAAKESPSGPPPPPPPGMGIPPPPPPMEFNNIEGPSHAASDPRSALLESIRQGKKLKKVDEKPAAGPDRGDFLNEIRQGTKLRPTEERPDLPPITNEPSSSSDALALALKRALAQRKGAIQSDSDDDTDESFDNDDEWED